MRKPISISPSIPEFPVSLYTGIRQWDFDRKNAVFKPLQNVEIVYLAIGMRGGAVRHIKSTSSSVSP